jgi:acetoin utilization deacetylase AcuC-like enzyme
LTTLILHHDDCLAHDPGVYHPESSARLRAVLAAVRDLRGTELLPAPLASLQQVTRVHGEEYWARLVAAEPASGQVAVDPDTLLSPGSINAALRGSGAACFAVDQIFAGKVKNAFCAVRPPGHHAAADLAMGFCLINHVAVAARHALATQAVKRVAIVDFDVHHGNGTQAIFEQSPEVFFISSHQMPLYPGTGHPDEVGCGNILNMPLQANSGSKEFRHAWSQLGFPALHAFAPDLILVSAGFDAHAGDPLGQLKLKDRDYSWITAAICEYAAESCDGRVISVLEGGYNLEALASAARAHVKALAQARP